MKIRKVDDKPMVIHTKEKAKIHAHEPKGAKIKGSNIYTVERGPKTDGAKVTDTDRKKSYRKSTIHQSESKNCQHFFRQIFLGYFSDIVQAFDTLRKNVCGDDYTSLHNPIVLSSVLPAYGMFHSIQILFL